MLQDLRRSAVAVVVLTVLLGVLYPLAVTGIAQPLFGAKADGDARLVAHAPSSAPGLFQPRPSATDFSATATSFSNAGPNGEDTAEAIKANAEAYAAREGIAVRDVPNDAAQTSASGIDPDISPANARIQARRVARERGLPADRVLDVVAAVRRGRLLGVVGEPTVNVNDLNDRIEELTR
ncbi:potassium-transporting ATPase subunit C [Conexibacter sp. SYSU D00693]|uniref:potassium-transporting ATPase subunit C n=1 Tax=Conexibacter sp. SYSU D00693 TaxID=2812560 RepID=UPI00196B56CD|nr:potassium-transporting ATPase subunit C [Conexibacter sp. SYSU D00693]